MSFLIVPLFCLSVGFVVFLGASWLLSYLRGRNPRAGHSARRERKAARVIGVAVSLGFATVFVVGSALNGDAGLEVSAAVDGVILLVALAWVWRILTARTTGPGR
jgi:branched-subunit amino acid ABC-type transport system permease component